MTKIQNAYSLALASGAGVGAYAVTPHDTDPQGTLATNPCRIFVTGTGNLVATGLDGADFTVALPNHTLFPVYVTRVKAATTCTGVFAIKSQ